VIIALCLVACSERTTEDPGNTVIDDPTNNNNTPSLKMSQKEAFAYIKDSMQYLDQEFYLDPQWLCINTTIELGYHAYEKSGGIYTNNVRQRAEYSLTVMANISLKDNSQSVALIELSNIYAGQVYLGLYYYGSTTYLVVGTKKYYTEQLNLTKIGQTIADALKMGTKDETDIPEFIGNALQANIDIDAVKGIIGLVWQIAFESEYVVSYSTEKYTYKGLDENGREKTFTVPKYQYVNEYLKANWILGMLSSGRISIGSFLDLEISWESFGLPNLDHILQDTIGFGLIDIIEKDWPSVTFSLNAVTEIKPVTLSDGGTGYKYVFNGLGIDITTDTGEFDVNLAITPFIMEVCNEKRVSISFAGYNLGAGGKGTTYTEGSLTNIEANMQIAVNNSSNDDDVLTLGEMLGNVIPLGSIGEIPIVVGAEASYVLDLGVAASIDLFDNSNNYLQLKLGYNDREVLAVYLVPDLTNTVIDGGKEIKILNTLYFDFHNLKSGGKEFLPNTKLSAIDLTKSLTGLLGEELMTFIDPYRGDTTASRNAASNASSVEITEPTGMNVMKIIELLIAEKKEPDENGRYKYLSLPKKGQSSVFSVNLDNYAINAFASMFVGGMTLVEDDDGAMYYENGIGIKQVALSIDFKNPLSSIKLGVDVNDNTSLAVSIGSQNEDGTYNKGIGYFVRPDFDFSALGLDKDLNVPDSDAAVQLRGAYQELSKTLSYAAALTGNFALGSDAGTTMNLDSIMAYLTENLLAQLGFNIGDLYASINIDSGSELRIQYEIQLAASLVNLGSASAVIDLYFLDKDGTKRFAMPFLEIYYNGKDDTLYINTQVNEEQDLTAQLNEALPLTNAISGKVPKLCIRNTGIGAMLNGKGLDIAGLFSLLGVIGYEKGESGSAAGKAIYIMKDSLNAAEDPDGGVEVKADDNSILSMIGGMFSSIEIKDGALGVIVNKDVMGVVLGIAGLAIEEGLPQVNGSLYLHLGTEFDKNEDGEKLYQLADGTIYTIENG
ncbi:MAG: hypothetical protein ACI4M8_04805, partial [Christensenellales bacterium]